MANIDEIKKKAEDSKDYRGFEKSLTDDEKEYFEGKKGYMKAFYSSESGIKIVKGEGGELEIEGLDEAMEELGLGKEETEQSEKEVIQKRSKKVPKEDNFSSLFCGIVSLLLLGSIIANLILISNTEIFSTDSHNEELRKEIKSLKRELKTLDPDNTNLTKSSFWEHEKYMDYIIALKDTTEVFSKRIENKRERLMREDTRNFAKEINEIHKKYYKNKTLNGFSLLDQLIDDGIIEVWEARTYLNDNDIEVKDPGPYDWDK